MLAMPSKKTLKWSFVAALVLATGFAGAGDPLRLPRDGALPQGEGSPGPVTFSHASHVDAESPRCVTCHPLAFSILQRVSTAKRPAITHDAMEKKGQACGACHGKGAFGFDDCTMCHKS
jgi:c(7)-type cytochrome triheme protein